MVTRAQQVGVVIGLAIVTALTILRASDPQLLRLARDLTFDQYQRLVPRTFENQPVRVIDIDEASLREFGQWPWPRNRIAALVDRLYDLGASAIAFDILFAEPDRLSPSNVVRDVTGIDPSLLGKLPDNDEIFSQSLSGRPVVLGFGLSNEGSYLPPVKAGFAYTGESPFDAPPAIKAATPLQPKLEANAAGLGHISLNPGASSAVVRAVPLFLSSGKQLYPSLALEALRVAQGVHLHTRRGAGHAEYAHPGQDREFRGAGNGGWRALALYQPRYAGTVYFGKQGACGRRRLRRYQNRHRGQHRVRWNLCVRPPGCPHDSPW